MDKDEILEKTVEEVTEDKNEQNLSSASPPGTKEVEQKPVQDGTDAENLNAGGNEANSTAGAGSGNSDVQTNDGPKESVAVESKPARRPAQVPAPDTAPMRARKPGARNQNQNVAERAGNEIAGRQEPPAAVPAAPEPERDREQRAGTEEPNHNEGNNPGQNGENNAENTRNRENGTLDDIAVPLRDLAMQNGGEIQEGEEADGSFDTLQELKELKSSQPEEPQNNENGAAELQKKVDEARRGEIYSAVVLAKGLKDNQPNPFASGRASRFFNSSKLDKAFDVNKIAIGANGIASSWDQDYGASTLGNSISLVVNMIALVGSLRDIIKKIKGFRNMPKLNKEMDEKQKKEAIRDKAFGVLGIISDASVVLLRVCGVAKAIAGLAGQGKSVFAKVTGYVSLALGGFSQIVGLSTSVNQMMKLKENKKKLETDREKAGARVDELKNKYFPEAKPEDSEEGGDSENDTAPAQIKKAPGGRTRAEIAVLLMEQGGVKEEEKDDLVRYLMLERKAGKLNEQLMNGIFGLTTLSTGLISTITGSVSSGLKNKTETEEQKKRSKGADLGNQIAGTVSNSAVIIGAGKNLTQGVMKKVKEKNPSDEERVLQNRAKGVLEEMEEKKYGLKGIKQGLEDDPNDEQKAAATQALEKYAAADKRLQGLGVNYKVLLKAHDEKAFEKALIAGI